MTATVINYYDMIVIDTLILGVMNLDKGVVDFQKGGGGAGWGWILGPCMVQMLEIRSEEGSWAPLRLHVNCLGAPVVPFSLIIPEY